MFVFEPYLPGSSVGFLELTPRVKGKLPAERSLEVREFLDDDRRVDWAPSLTIGARRWAERFRQRDFLGRHIRLPHPDEQGDSPDDDNYDSGDDDAPALLLRLVLDSTLPNGASLLFGHSRLLDRSAA
jgi:hypothetical protein